MRKLHVHQLNMSHPTEKEWHDLLTARTQFFIETRPNDPVPSHQNQRQSLSNIPDLPDHVIFWLLYDNDANCVGFCTLQHPKREHPDYAANKESVYVEPVVLAPFRQQGIGTQLLPWIVNYAQKIGAAWVQWDTNFKSGFRFSEKIGATEAGHQRTNRLAVEQVDWEMMHHWTEQGESRNPDVTLIRFVNLPPQQIIAAYCDLVTDINRLQPTDNLEGMSFSLTPETVTQEAHHLTAQKTARVVLCTREQNGRLSGMTDMIISKAKPTHAKISLTGVQRAFQGRGLGKWLKAAMLLDVRQTFPDVAFVDTENFNSNRAMLNINQRIGFTLFEQYIFYKMRVSDLAIKAAPLNA